MALINTDYLHARIDPRIKKKAEMILNREGLSNAEAIRLFYGHICLNKKMPFDLNIVKNGTKEKVCRSSKELFENLVGQL